MLSKDRELKQLSSQIQILTGDIEAMKIDISVKQRELAAKQRSITDIEQKIQKIRSSSTGLNISEHAILRYLERVKGWDREVTYQEILNNLCGIESDGEYTVGGITYKIKNHGLVTVLKKEAKEATHPYESYEEDDEQVLLNEILEPRYRNLLK